MKTKEALIAATLVAIFAVGCVSAPPKQIPRSHRHNDDPAMTIDEFLEHLTEEEQQATTKQKREAIPTSSAATSPATATPAAELALARAASASADAEGAHLRIDSMEPWVLDNRQRIQQLEQRVESTQQAVPAPRPALPPATAPTTDLGTFKTEQIAAANEAAALWLRRARSPLATPKFQAYAESVAAAYHARAKAISEARSLSQAQAAANQ